MALKEKEQLATVADLTQQLETATQQLTKEKEQHQALVNEFSNSDIEKVRQ